MNKLIASVKKFWNDKKGLIAIISTVISVLLAALVVRNSAVTNDFLKEHNLFDKFYEMDEV
jgi:hypothetical protein